MDETNSAVRSVVAKGYGNRALAVQYLGNDPMLLTIYYKTKDSERKIKQSMGPQILVGGPGEIAVDLNLLEDSEISCPHIQLFYSLGTWWIKDLASDTGTRVNDEPIKGVTELKPLDEVKVGKSVLTLEFAPTEDITVSNPEKAASLLRCVDFKEPGIAEANPIKYHFPASLKQAQQAVLEELRDYIQNNAGYSLATELLCKITARFEGAERATLLIRNRREFVPVAHIPEGKSFVSYSLVRRAIKSRQAIIWERAGASAKSQYIESRAGASLAVYCPILSDRRVIGVIHLDTSRLDVDFDTAFLGEIGKVIAPAFEPILSRLTLPSVFISYSHKDENLIDGLADDLRRQQVSVWYDKQMRVGRDFRDQIQAQIQKADAFVLALSESSLQSKYVKMERELAKKAGKLILPIIVESCKLPQDLRFIHYSDFTDDYRDGLEDLIYEVYELGQ